jgi:hypothetical protein
MDQTYFQINGRFYKQNFGTSIGNSLSPFLANLFMADFEVKLSKLKTFPHLWIRYVDDIFCVMKKNGAIGRLLTIMNKRHNTIKFTHEQDNANVLCFLDIEIKRVGNNLEFNVFRKPTAVPR